MHYCYTAYALYWTDQWCSVSVLLMETKWKQMLFMDGKIIINNSIQITFILKFNTSIVLLLAQFQHIKLWEKELCEVELEAYWMASSYLWILAYIFWISYNWKHHAYFPLSYSTILIWCRQSCFVFTRADACYTPLYVCFYITPTSCYKKCLSVISNTTIAT